MKVLPLFLSLSLLLHSLCFSEEEKWKIQLETYSSSEIEQTQRFQYLHEVYPEFHKTLIRFQSFPKAETYVLKCQRPILSNAEIQHEITKAVLLSTQDLLEESAPCFVLVSNGYFPGEVIDLWIETDNGDSKSSKFKFVPQPVHVKSTSGEISLTAELTKDFTYALKIDGLTIGEEFNFVSNALGEIIEKKVIYTKECEMHVSPGVKGTNTGFVTISVTRKNNDQLNITLPWGMEFQNHLIGESLPVVHFFESIRK